MKPGTIAYLVWCLMIVFLPGCTRQSQDIAVLASFPLDSIDGVIAQSDVRLDKETSSDGKGSLRIAAKEPITVKLFEVSNVSVEDARLIYEARIKTEAMEGKVYLEMWCQFPGKGEFFSRGLQSAASGNTNWMTMTTPFFLKKGEKPERIKLNLVVAGSGTVWIDDIRLVKGPLK